MLTADLEGLRAAADTAEAAAAELRALDVTTPFNDVGAALPGSSTTQACLWIGTRLGAALQVYADGVDSLAGSARSVADLLESTDAGVGSLLGGPR